MTTATDSASSTDAMIEALIGALPAWQLTVFRFNEAVAQRLGIVATDLQCLFVLDRGGPTSATEIANRVNLTSGATSRMIDRLLHAELVTREHDADDRRRVRVSITPGAHAALHALYDPLDDVLRGLLDPLDPAVLAELLEFVGHAQQRTEEEERSIRTGTSRPPRDQPATKTASARPSGR